MAIIRYDSFARPGTHDPIDQIFGTALSDIIYGGYGQADPSDLGDIIYAYGGDDQVYANGGNDYVNAGEGSDSVWGGGGDDEIHGYGGNDILFGSEGVDTIFGGTGSDVIYGGRGEADPNDLTDLIYGGAGNDRIYANGGDDTIVGGADIDQIWGGAGKDTFKFFEYWSSYWTNGRQIATVTRDSSNERPDRIYGFEKGDRIDLRGIDGDVTDRYDYYLGFDLSRPLNTGNDDIDANVLGRTFGWSVGGGNTLIASEAGFAVILVGYTGGLVASDFIL